MRFEGSDAKPTLDECIRRAHVAEGSISRFPRRRRRRHLARTSSNRRHVLSRFEGLLYPSSPSCPGQGRRRNRVAGVRTRAGEGRIESGAERFRGVVLSTLGGGNELPRWRLTTCVVSLHCFSAS